MQAHRIRIISKATLQMLICRLGKLAKEIDIMDKIHQIQSFCMSIFPKNKSLNFSGLKTSAYFECCLINYSNSVCEEFKIRLLEASLLEEPYSPETP